MENKLKLQIMDYNLYLEGIFNKQPSFVICDQHNLKVKTKNEYFKFEISLNLHLQWIYVEGQINEVRFENHSLKGPIENLEKLKNCLDCRVIYLGAAQLYEQYLIVKEDEFKKTMVVKSKTKGGLYFCKAYKKEIRENEHKFLKELKILRMLKENKNVVRVLEVFESKHNYYMIMEYMIRNLEQDYTHEENQIIIKEILNILEDLNQKSIIHGQIRPKNFMFNKDNVMKLIGFSKTKIIQEEVQGEDIYDLHRILLHLNGLSQNVLDYENGYYPHIPSHGTNFLKSLLNPSKYRINIKQALTHPFLNCNENDHQIARKEMNLKFKHSFNSFQ
ncbi:unnamed protein product (macronuclear) [Paramecium tetraurelia]|uniref:Protein kinase domain-containing protein n=1 Tax=Paramecium tetraurelia TaxID=5888 RepID=A0BY64_PARTE|nr:uncharacterized protein GSPATT00033334001 [Paramecium tetraurelia]CAK63481.1 unnamed protein product [Paramecium tetraurelia]|eukprot:XP_001430879.1 hypothetical protein (macronuclear) [Paramecium tetraurelia strain d4-2]